MTWLAAIMGALAVPFWFGAVACWIVAVRHRKPEVTLASFLVRGYQAFSPDFFAPEGVVYQQRFMACAAGFFGCVLLSALLGVLAGASQG